VVFIIAVVPMFFVALAYKHLTDAAPDAGIVFTWGSKAILPHIGWIGGYALLLSSVLAGVGAAGITVNAVTVSLGLENASNWPQMAIAAAFISPPPGWSPEAPRSPREPPCCSPSFSTAAYSCSRPSW
jgi:amino acid transporter